MSWAKFDDRYDDNRKVKRAWRQSKAAVGLHAMAITYCCRHRTDGLVDVDWVEEKLPNQRERDKAVTSLVASGLFEVVDGEHWRVHDFLDYNRSKKAQADLSEAAREAALVRWSGAGDAPRNADPHAEGNAERMRNPVPLPSRPDPSSSAGAREVGLAELLEEAQTVLSQLAGRDDADEMTLANLHARFPSVPFLETVRGCAQRLKENPDLPTGQTLHRFFERQKPAEPKAGRSKNQREAEDMAALHRLGGAQ